MGVSDLLNELGSAVETAKAKKDEVDKLTYELTQLVTARQSGIDAAQTEYDDAKVAAERLQEQVRSMIGDLLPTPDPRYRVSK